MSDRPKREQRRAGTAVMLGGTIYSIVVVYLFQVISSRTLGADAFAPVGVLWTVTFLAFTVAMIPVEQFVTRRLVHDGGIAADLRPHRVAMGGVFVLAILVGGGFVAATLDLFFDGNTWWIGIAVVLLINRSVLAMARGYLAGRWRFVSYGLAAVAEGTLLLVLGGIAAIAAPSALAFALAMMVAPLAVLVLRPFRSTKAEGIPATGALVGAGAGFLGFYIVASAASQLVIAGGPIVVGLIGGTSAAVSVYFITFTLFRGPITSSYSLIARVLPDFTRLAVSGEQQQLAAWSRRLAAGGVVLGIAGFVVAGLLGPWIITVLYGAEFAPDRTAAALGGAAVGAGLAALFSGQILVGRGRTDMLAGSWIVALVAATVAVFVLDAGAVTRVAAGFAVGEGTALAMLTISGIVAARQHA